MKRFAVLAGVAALLLLAGIVLAQSSPNYNLEWHTMSGVGQPAGSSRYMVYGVAAQEAAEEYPSSSNYRVSGGFWAGVGPTAEYTVYLPLVVRGYP